MPTDIHFAGAHLPVTVDADPGQVAEAFTSANGLPFRLTCLDGRAEVYINPAVVAFWSASTGGGQPGPPQDPQPPADTRQRVTDIWGNPLRKDRRR